MKRIILLLLCVVLAQNVFSQTNYYPNSSGSIPKNGYTYKYTPTRLGNVSKELYNSDAVYYGVTKIARLDGRAESYEEKINSKSGIDSGSKGHNYIDNLIKSKFSEEQINRIKQDGFGLMIKLTINSATGEIADVVFTFPGFSNFKEIPVEVFRSIELALKRELEFTMNDRGRQYNYGMIVWTINF